MANVLKFKRRSAGGGAGAPSSLKSGEVAHNEADNILYIGKGDDGSGNATSIVPLAGVGGFVDRNTDQTVGGVKTFSSSPIVPTPTTDMQASTKKYVDDTVAGLGAGDMSKATYDPTNKNADAFSMGNMVETSTKKILSDTERTKLSGIATGADVTSATNVGSSIHGATAKTTPVDADTMPLIDSAASNVLKKVTWANIKATLKTYFDTLYATAAHTHTFASLTSKPTTLSGYGITDALASSLKGANNGLAELDSGGKVPTAQLPDAVLGAMAYQGTWNASTDSPALPAAASGNKGHYYVVSTAGSTNKGGITDWKIGDWIVSNGAAWEKVDNTDQVTSVAGRQGAVTLSTADISGLGTMATQAANNVAITGGTIDGVTLDGGTF